MAGPAARASSRHALLLFWTKKCDMMLVIWEETSIIKVDLYAVRLKMSQYDDSPKHHLHPLTSRQTSGPGGTAVRCADMWHTPHTTHGVLGSGAAVGDLSLRQHGASHIKLENRHTTPS